MMPVILLNLGLPVGVHMTQKTAAAESQNSAGRSPVLCECESVCVNVWLCCVIVCVSTRAREWCTDAPMNAEVGCRGSKKGIHMRIDSRFALASHIAETLAACAFVRASESL